MIHNNVGKVRILGDSTPDRNIILDFPSTTLTYGHEVTSPYLPPYDSLAPIPLPQTPPAPLCVSSPTIPLSPPSTVILPPPSGGSEGGGYTYPSPPPIYSYPNLPPTQFYPPPTFPNSPTIVYPSPTNLPPSPEFVPAPATPIYLRPSPPQSPPTANVPFTPLPPEFTPAPTVFLPPVVYPPPAVPPPPYIAPPMALWCVAKPSVPEPIIQEAMNYACGSGADCDQILPNGSCFSPDSLIAHASFAFNSYWQRTKVGGGTCEFGGTAMLVTVDPSKLLISFVLQIDSYP